MKYYLVLVLLFLFRIVPAQQKLSREEIHDKGIKRTRVYSISIENNQYEKPLYYKKDLAYEYTYDTSGRLIAYYHYRRGRGNSMEYHIHITKDSTYKFDSNDRPLSSSTWQVYEFESIRYTTLSRTVLFQKHYYNDKLGIHKIINSYKNNKILSTEYFYKEPDKKSKPTYKEGYEKYDDSNKVIVRNISTYSRSGRRLREINYKLEDGELYSELAYYYNKKGEILKSKSYDKNGKLLSVHINEATTEVEEPIHFIPPTVSDSIDHKVKMPFSFTYKHKDSIILHINVFPYSSARYDELSKKSRLTVSVEMNDRIIETIEIITESIPDTNNITVDFINSLLHYNKNEEHNELLDIDKFDDNGNLKFRFSRYEGDGYYNRLYEYDFYKTSLNKKDSSYLDQRINGTGKVIEYSNGIKLKESFYKNNQLNGKTTTWYSNGQIQSVADFAEDLKNKITIEYDSTGNIISKEEFTKGVPSGTYELYEDSNNVMKIYYKITLIKEDPLEIMSDVDGLERFSPDGKVIRSTIGKKRKKK